RGLLVTRHPQATPRLAPRAPVGVPVRCRGRRDGPGVRKSRVETMTHVPAPGAAPRVAGLGEIRGHFPALQRRYHGHPGAYLAGPGGRQVPRAVADAVGDYLLHHNANTHWAFPTSEETDALLLGARRALGDFLNASPDEVAFGANMTTLTFHLARAIGRGLG